MPVDDPNYDSYPKSIFIHDNQFSGGGEAPDSEPLGCYSRPPQQSILLYRMKSQAADEMMPELGCSLVYNEGIELIQRWIDEMSGGCPLPSSN